MLAYFKDVVAPFAVQHQALEVEDAFSQGDETSATYPLSVMSKFKNDVIKAFKDDSFDEVFPVNEPVFNSGFTALNLARAHFTRKQWNNDSFLIILALKLKP